MRFTASQIADVVNGRFLGEPVEVDGVSIDSRSIMAGQLFVPIIAERDGHDFIAAAADGGAVAYLTSRGPKRAVSAVAVEVADTSAALTALGSHVRSTRLSAPVVGVTGSVGKTTVKDMIAAVLATERATTASAGSFNNELGVPLTLVNAADGTEASVIEMGARGKGHIAHLCDIAQPTIGVVTLVAMVHTELFGDLAGVARSKGELVEALPSDGVAVLNADDPLVSAMAERTKAQVVTFGARGNVRAGHCEFDDDLRASLEIFIDTEAIEVTLGASGAHQVPNALAAAAVGWVVGISPAGIAAGLAARSPSRWRMEFLRGARGMLIINDAYNANPASMRAALEALAATASTRRVAILGLMAELGPSAAAAHREVARDAAASGIEVIAVAAPDYGPIATHVADHDEAVTALWGDSPSGPETAVLVKGSRVARLEELAERLVRG